MAAKSGTSPAAKPALRYADVGVDIGANDRLIPRFKQLAESASRPEVIDGVGAFSGLFDLSGYPDPVLVASTDGVGTKVIVARLAGRYDSVGEDLVNHCVNDILTAGARPLFFLDYLANNGLSEDQKVAVVSGVARACASSGLALLGGETADMPGVYQPGDFDLAGTIVGLVEKGKQINGATIVPGDVLIGLPSNGLHTSGYSLARAALGLTDDAAVAADLLREEAPELGETLADALLHPHRCYWSAVEPVLRHCKGIAHITGGGIAGNLVRVLPAGSAAKVRRGALPEPAIFRLIQQRGKIDDEEMFRVFNMGIGIILVVAETALADVRAAISEAKVVGEIVATAAAPSVEIVPLQ